MCDVRNGENVKEVFERARKELGGVDVVVKNAGLAHNAPLLSSDSETADWKDMLDVSSNTNINKSSKVSEFTGPSAFPLGIISNWYYHLFSKILLFLC